MEKAQKITACAFLHNDGKLFIAKRAASKKFLPNKWELPGGHIEWGETMEAGLQREFMEEFNLKVIVGDPFHAFTYSREDMGTHVIEVIYFVTLGGASDQIQLNPADHSESLWISANEVEKYLDPHDKETEAVLKGFKLLPTKTEI